MPEPITRDGIIEALREMPADATIDDATASRSRGWACEAVRTRRRLRRASEAPRLVIKLLAMTRDEIVERLASPNPDASA